ncbi:sensor histidine kinase [Paenibacillus sp. FSL E2-0230]|uniref:cache domain-containing sensor histidine kinase n=1 Tax=Paenibacillus sp. FSL E2-0230 TaxID=2954727 RepID=UPI0030D563C2
MLHLITNRYRLKTIRNRIMVYFSLIFAIVILLVGFAGYRYISNTLMSEIDHYSEKIVEEKKGNIDSFFSQIVTLLQMTASNSLLADAMLQENRTDYGKLLLYQRQVEAYLTNMQKFNAKIKDLIIIDMNGIVYDQTGPVVSKEYRFYGKSWMGDVPYPFFKVKFLGIHDQNYYSEADSGQIISAAAPIYDFNRSTPNTRATLLCNLNVSEIEAVAKETRLEKSGFLIILDENGAPIYQPHTDYRIETIPHLLKEKTLLPSGDFILNNDSESYKVVYTTSKVTGWKIAAFIPMREVQSHMQNLGTYIIGAIAASILLIAFSSYFLSAQITRPFVSLMRKMQRIERGDLDVQLLDDSSDEMHKVTQRMDSMIENIQSLTRDVYAYQIQGKVMELQALQSQINPHFLYNTLQSVKALAVTGRNADISKMVTLMGGILRYAINNVQETVTVEQELQHSDTYMKIQKFRYPDQFLYEVYCEKGLERTKMPKLILQPLIENAILHGFEGGMKGKISVRVEKAEAGIRISIEDNGKGMSLEEETKLQRRLEMSPVSDNTAEGGVGLINVHHRIRMKYGERYGVAFETVAGQGTRMEIQLPCLEEST